MSKNKKSIPNPSRLSEEERNFIQNINHEPTLSKIRESDKITQEGTKCKGRPISMSDSFYAILNDYLKQNPTEGNRSSFVVRIVADYIKTKTTM